MIALSVVRRTVLVHVEPQVYGHVNTTSTIYPSSIRVTRTGTLYVISNGTEYVHSVIQYK